MKKKTSTLLTILVFVSAALAIWPWWPGYWWMEPEPNYYPLDDDPAHYDNDEDIDEPYTVPEGPTYMIPLDDPVWWDEDIIEDTTSSDN